MVFPKKIFYIVFNILLITTQLQAQPVNPGGNTSNTASTYLGNIATDVSIPTGSEGGANSFQTRSVHVAWENVSFLAYVIPNWYANASVGEVGNTVNMTITASLEYPVNTFTQMTWNGATSVVCATLQTCVTDMKTLTTPIPKGATFYVRIHAVMGNNYIPIRSIGGASINAYITGNNIADQTMGGTVNVNQYNSVYFTPAAIISYTKIPSVLMIGDSRLAGYFDSADFGVNDIGDVEKGLAKGVPVINEGVSGDWAGQWPMTLRASLQQYVTHVVSEYGINNIRSSGANQNLVATESALASVYSLFPNKIIFQTTLEPNTNSTDSWLTVTNQSATSWESTRQAFNTQARTYGIPGTNGTIDTAHCVETSSSGTTQSVDNGGFWKADGTVPGKYTGDGLHPYTLANDMMMFQGCVNPARIVR